MKTFGQLTNTLGMKDIVNNMLRPQSKDLKVTKIVESIMDIKPNPVTERYLYFDPKVCFFSFFHF